MTEYDDMPALEPSPHDAPPPRDMLGDTAARRKMREDGYMIVHGVAIQVEPELLWRPRGTG